MSAAIPDLVRITPPDPPSLPLRPSLRRPDGHLQEVWHPARRGHRRGTYEDLSTAVPAPAHTRTMSFRLLPEEPDASPWRVEPSADVLARLLDAAGGPDGRPRLIAVDGRSGRRQDDARRADRGWRDTRRDGAHRRCRVVAVALRLGAAPRRRRPRATSSRQGRRFPAPRVGGAWPRRRDRGSRGLRHGRRRGRRRQPQGAGAALDENRPC